MYLRQSNQKRADGSVLSHLQIAENVWDPVLRRGCTFVSRRGVVLEPHLAQLASPGGLFGHRLALRSRGGRNGIGREGGRETHPRGSTV